MKVIRRFTESLFVLLFLLFAVTSFSDTLWTEISIPVRDGNTLKGDLYSRDTLWQALILIQTQI